MTKSPQPWPPVETEPAVPHPQAPPAGTKLGMHYEHCFGCGDQQDAGLRLRSTVGEGGTVTSQFLVTEAHQGAPGLAHGGLLACAFDEALGATVGHLLRRPAVTGKLETDFVKPVPVGSTLFIQAKLDGVAGRKIYVSADGRLDAEDGPIALRARGLFVQVGFEHFAKHAGEESVERLKASGRAAERDWDINP
ncbi:PaaI family thioesterase [Amycolatopsis sp. 195334CR]|uniref:PaaI family thioesterase n=1 Tax=Amycolatopsis sp. 195334CR TaxID=2814588 RepID=UPI001A8EAD4F|nr:PaaI family thioesterase [Amycolatopsis sp. 195334CR]MBN6036020.1 PaaI family thioesterase [Amycolatopsis sp. 195334CR]